MKRLKILPKKEKITNISRIFNDLIAKVLPPPPDLKVSDWADKYRYLSPEASAESGKWYTSRAEYLRGIMDSVNEPEIETVVVMSSSQVGKTEFLLNIIGYYISHDPCPILMIQPTDGMTKDFSKDRFAPMIRDTPILTDKIQDAKSRNSGNTISHKSFSGGHITMIGSNSPSQLASRPIRIVLADEVDRYPTSSGTEGDPINLSKKRSATFYNKKLLMVSTPTIKGSSRIEVAYEQSDQRRYLVPCPFCGEYQSLKWARVKWDKNDKGEHLPKTAWYECEFCLKKIEHKKKHDLLRKGKWKKTSRSINGKTAGFHLNELYSPWKQWSEVVEDFLEAKNLPDLLQTWTNTSMGESFEIKGEGIDDIPFLERCEEIEEGTIPEKALILTAGVDVQNDRLECEVRAWGMGEETWGIDYFVIYGTPEIQDTWDQLDDIINKKYKHPIYGNMVVSYTCVDSGGHNTDAVYRYCKAREGRRVYAIKGSSQHAQPIIPSKTRRNRQGVLLIIIGTDTAKDTIFQRLKLKKEGAGYCHFPTRYDPEYFAQLSAEKVITKFDKGYKKRVWVKTRQRNEALDCFVYNLAAIKLIQPSWKALKTRLDKKSLKLEKQDYKKDNKKSKKVKKGGFVNSWK